MLTILKIYNQTEGWPFSVQQYLSHRDIRVQSPPYSDGKDKHFFPILNDNR